MDAGAATELLDEAWWGASVAPTSKTGALFVLGERSVPHGIIVDAQGRRFANESEAYVDLGHHMLEHDKDGDFWLVTDKIHALKYLRNYMLDPSGAKALKAEGVLHKEDTIEELAVSIGADPAVLRETVERFNGFARAGWTAISDAATPPTTGTTPTRTCTPTRTWARWRRSPSPR
ncbi:MAG: FAD-binding protein [Candidatus Corynebacterium faecigallinarum]